ncbi:hypothetical protein OV079_23335 [Nannocystis pusilla]|uniref:Uncharacterized protein n=1 Tax=Nannocystis pusilla TaxID=889268 RepID=A0A9X3ERC4_9BACT|nr:hypothetical protein [Nannocystis pusilla]MCY1008435.1 hypothetical protein [Nannocystis pusilla]
MDGPLVEAAPTDPCPRQHRCTVVRVPASFRVRAHLDGGGRESAALLARIEQHAEVLESCMNASLRRDRCIRSGAALLYRLQPSGAPEWIAVDGAADDRALACVDRELRELDLRRFMPPATAPSSCGSWRPIDPRIAPTTATTASAWPRARSPTIPRAPHSERGRPRATLAERRSPRATCPPAAANRDGRGPPVAVLQALAPDRG